MKPASFSTFVFVVASLLLTHLGVARACYVDTDCPGSACGGQVCDWAIPSSDGYTCVPAGTAVQGADGWCDSVANCKCQAQGATCNAPYCSFTLLMDGGVVDGGSSLTLDAAAPPAMDAGGLAPPDGGAATTCLNDTDCPGAECGGQVCDWSLPISGTGRYTCVPAGTAPPGSDGWCTTIADCKCLAQGATCNAPHCSFTVAQVGQGGDSGSAAAPDASGVDATTGTGGEPPSSGAATSGTSGYGSGKSSGCAIETAGGDASSAGIALVGLVAVLAFRRRP